MMSPAESEAENISLLLHVGMTYVLPHMDNV